MTHERSLPAPPPASDGEHLTAPSDRVILAGAGVTALWVLTWLTVQLRGELGWVLSFLPATQ